jgi:hydroxyacylglutathione hydrolase
MFLLPEKFICLFFRHGRSGIEVIPGIHKIDGMRGVNCYLIVNGERLLVVDSGIPGEAKKIVAYVARLGKKPSDIQYVILTHADIDHVGSAKELRRLTGARIAIHPGDVPVLTGKQKFKTINNHFKPVVRLVMSLMRFQPLEPDVVLSHGDILEGWQIFHTPGHTPGSICVYQPGKSIFVGDALRTSSLEVPRPISRRICLDMAQTKKSLTAIADLDYAVLLPGHGAPIVGKASQQIKDMLIRYKGSRKLGD